MLLVVFAFFSFDLVFFRLLRFFKLFARVVPDKHTPILILFDFDNLRLIEIEKTSQVQKYKKKTSTLYNCLNVSATYGLAPTASS